MLYHITFTGVRRMKKSPYDRERFFEKYSQMDRSRLGLAGAGEWESLEPLLPDFAGKRVLDLGCGYGWHCIYAAEHGAAAVTGVDLSEKMLAVAREKTTAPQVTSSPRKRAVRRPSSKYRSTGKWRGVPSGP